MKVYFEFFESKLKPIELLVLSYVVSFGAKGCKVVNKNIAKKFNVSLKTALTAVNSLIEMKLLKDRYDYGKRILTFDYEEYKKNHPNFTLESVSKVASDNIATEEENAPQTKKTAPISFSKEESERIKNEIDKEILGE